VKIKYTPTAKDIQRDIMRKVRQMEPCRTPEIEVALHGKHRAGDVRTQVLMLIDQHKLELTSDRRIRIQQ
jgi:hypothetical protein